MSKLAQLIAKQEGFGILGDMPTRQNNPGDLRHAPGEIHDVGSPNGIGSFDSVADGFAALERQLGLYAERGLTLRQAIYAFAPPNENDSGKYLEFVCEGLGCHADTPISEVLKI